eukprot:6207764-Pleurochrysis_carterae.AAC.2
MHSNRLLFHNESESKRNMNLAKSYQELYLKIDLADCFRDLPAVATLGVLTFVKVSNLKWYKAVTIMADVWCIDRASPSRITDLISGTGNTCIPIALFTMLLLKVQQVSRGSRRSQVLEVNANSSDVLSSIARRQKITNVIGVHTQWTMERLIVCQLYASLYSHSTCIYFLKYH